MTELAPSATRKRAAKTRRRMIINIAVVVVVVAAAGAYWNARRSQPKLPEGLVTAPVARTSLTQVVSATGSVTAQTGAMVKIGSQITGRIKRLYADVGDKMKAGELIAELDVPDLEANVRQAEALLSANRARLAQELAGVAQQEIQVRTDIDKARAGVSVAQSNLRQVEQSASLQLATAQAGVQQARANAVNSDANLKRTQELFGKGYVAQADVDNAKAQAEVNKALLASAEQNLGLVRTKIVADTQAARDNLIQAQATLAAAQAETAQNEVKRQSVVAARDAVSQSQATLAQARAQLAKAFIRTPISGTVLQLSQQQGETIAAGLSAPTLIIVADLDRLQVDAFVDETDIGRVRLGQEAQVTVDAYPNHAFSGRVAKIASGSTMQQNVVTYDVTIALQNAGQLLKPDMTATTNIIVARRKNVVAVPVDAVKLTTQGPTVTVMTKGPNGQPQFPVVSIRTGISDGEHTEVLAGVREGDTVVLSGQVPGMSTELGGPRMRGLFGFGGPRPSGRGAGTSGGAPRGGGGGRG